MRRLFRRNPMTRMVAPLLGSAFAVTIAFAGVAFVDGPVAVAQQSVQRIAAVVNDDIISVFDLTERTNLVMATSGIPDTTENRSRLLPRILQQLIDERLKMQEAKRRNITVTDADIERAKRQLEQQNNMPPGALDQVLERQGISPRNLEKQLRADIAWIKVAQSALRRQVSVEPEEVDALLASLRENQGKPRRQLAEIVLPVESPEREAEIRAAAERLVEQLRQGASFGAIARQISGSPTAALGGDLGWVPEGQLEPALEEALRNMEPGQISPPIRTASGYTILGLRDRRSGGAPAPDQAPLALSQLYMPTEGPAAIPAERRASLIEQARAASSCAELDRIATEANLPSSGSIGTIRPAELPPAAREAVVDLPAGQASAPVSVGAAEVVLMVCERNDLGGLPSRRQIEERLEAEKLERVAQRTLRDLRRAAMIDIRL